MFVLYNSLGWGFVISWVHVQFLWTSSFSPTFGHLLQYFFGRFVVSGCLVEPLAFSTLPYQKWLLRPRSCTGS